MVDTNARLVEPTQGIGETGLVEQAVPFRFTVTWTSVFDPLEIPKATTTSVAPVNDRLRAVIPAPTDALPIADSPVLNSQKRSASNPSVQWEMVVPKMVRAAPKPVRPSEIAASSGRSGPVLHQRPEPTRSSGSEQLKTQLPAVAPSETVEQSIPNFCSGASPSRSRISPRIKVLIGVTILAALAVPVWRYFGSKPPAAAEIQTTTRAGGWTREPVTRIDAGFNKARELVVYRPSLKATDCRFEFDWKVDTPGVGWVFRATDTANYYAMRIKVLKAGASPTYSVEHFRVYRGTESAHSEKMLVLLRSDPVLRVRTDIAGPSFTLYLGGTAADYWNDTQLTAGGLGFFEEWHQGSEVQGVRMSFAPGTELQRDGLRLYMNAPSGGD